LNRDDTARYWLPNGHWSAEYDTDASLATLNAEHLPIELDSDETKGNALAKCDGSGMYDAGENSTKVNQQKLESGNLDSHVTGGYAHQANGDWFW
jgi:hypothetical protein